MGTDRGHLFFPVPAPDHQADARTVCGRMACPIFPAFADLRADYAVSARTTAAQSISACGVRVSFGCLPAPLPCAYHREAVPAQQGKLPELSRGDHRHRRRLRSPFARRGHRKQRTRNIFHHINRGFKPPPSASTCGLARSLYLVLPRPPDY